VTTHFTGSSDITVALPPPDAMTLFTPEGERSWAGKDGWNPRYPVPSRTVGAGAVFTTQHQGRLTIWVIVDQQPDRIRYARVTPHGLAGTVEVRALSGSRAATTVRVTYDLTALTDAAAAELAGFAAGYHAEIDKWASDIAESLARRGTALGVPGSTGLRPPARRARPARSRLTKIDPREEDTMHPDILRQLAAEHTRDLITEAGQARRAREARHTQRRRPAAHLRRSTRLAAQQPGSRRRSRIPVTPAADGRAEASR
jgi:hypothetical protein